MADYLIGWRRTSRDIELTPFSLSELSDIKVSYQLANGAHASILIVAYDGIYRPGSAGNTDAKFMYAAALAGAAGADAINLILDFRKLDYVWGDMLELVYDAAHQTGSDRSHFAVVVGDGCREAVRTLELGENSTEPLSSIPWAHETIEDAYHYLSRR
ncbi:hypothetical protein [Sphingomonas colocasiae]|uniref:STAS/SEC14 domain-containing protein n=1 Tax=Sphingomonas colocasiae TaxID=1848973 RepID=A0ABS7PWU0_9SPHN|nr:hypothetical protein [Sphingomonas colocasiae]MBY8825120.1 hypothetical protein [Sphingomonas colocasiae]